MCRTGAGSGAAVASPAVPRTLLFIGAGRQQRGAIARGRELGLRVVAVDRNPDAPGLQEADVGEVVDFSDEEAVVALARRVEPDGVATVAADRAVPIVAAVAEALGLPGIGRQTAHAMTNKIAMRRRLAEAGVPQPRFAAVRGLREGYAALGTVGLPAVLKPADSAGQRGIFLLESSGDLEAHLHATLAESRAREAIVESFHEGSELNSLCVAREGSVRVVTLSDRMRPRGRGFGVALAHLYPSRFFADTLAEAERVASLAVHALGMRDGIAYPQLIASEDGVRVVEVAARIPAGRQDALVRYATGIDLVEIALRIALGVDVPEELVRPRFQRPLAVRFLTGPPGPLPLGRVRSWRGLERVLEAPGVVEADIYLDGRTIRPVQVDGDRHGYVIALAPSNLEALELAEAATRLIEVDVEAEAA
jgi:biotin carboxylase